MYNFLHQAHSEEKVHNIIHTQTICGTEFKKSLKSHTNILEIGWTTNQLFTLTLILLCCERDVQYVVSEETSWLNKV